MQEHHIGTLVLAFAACFVVEVPPKPQRLFRNQVLCTINHFSYFPVKIYMCISAVGDFRGLLHVLSSYLIFFYTE